MIYITGDCHNNFERFNTRNFPEQKEMTKDDYVIICGDFGGVWNKDGESKMETSALDWLDGKAFTTLFVDGNHENFDRLYAYPVEMWHGGKAHKIRPSVIHLMRGQIFELEEKRYLLLEVPAVMIFQPVFLSQMIQSSSLRKSIRPGLGAIPY
ncbi:MAG: metallophosphoesterase [Dorea formicigenerans]